MLIYYQYFLVYGSRPNLLSFIHTNSYTFSYNHVSVF